MASDESGHFENQMRQAVDRIAKLVANKRKPCFVMPFACVSELRDSIQSVNFVD